jgi:uncharacterized membrane protein YbhN (UPF0104 family)
MSRSRELLKRVVSIAIIASVAFFFYRAFQRNWAEIRAANLTLSYPLLFVAALAMLVCYLLSTYAWHVTINHLSEQRKLRFSQSFSTFNASGLTKYLPGKVWSYALQMYWLGNAGFSKAMVVYANLVNLVISLATSVLFGLLLLPLSTTRLPQVSVLTALVLLLVVELCIILFCSRVLSGLVALANRLLKREVRYFQLSPRFMLKLHVLYLLSAVAAGASSYLTCLGIGYDLEPGDAALVAAASSIADVAGFLAVIVPAGLGVREGSMYLLLSGVSAGSLPLLLPVVSRGVNMLVDIGLGLFALKLLRGLDESGTTDPPR